MIYYNPLVPVDTSHHCELTAYVATSRRRQADTPVDGYTAVASATLSPCSTPGFFSASIAPPGSTNVAYQFTTLNASNVVVAVDGPSCDPSTVNNFYTGISGSSGFVLVASQGGCNGSVDNTFTGSFDGSTVDCSIAWPLTPSSTAVPSAQAIPTTTATPAATADNAIAASTIVIIVVVIVVVVICALVALFLCMRYRQRKKVDEDNGSKKMFLFILF